MIKILFGKNSVTFKLAPIKANDANHRIDE